MVSESWEALSLSWEGEGGWESGGRGVCVLVGIGVSYLLYRERNEEASASAEEGDELNPSLPSFPPQAQAHLPSPSFSLLSRNQPHRPSTNPRPRRFLPPLQPRSNPTSPSPLSDKLPRRFRFGSTNSLWRPHRYPLARFVVEEDRVYSEGCG